MRQPSRLEGVRVEHLVAAAAVVGDEQRRLAQGQQLGERVRARPGEHDVRAGKRVRQVVREVLKLPVARRALEPGVQVALAADMQHVVLLRERGQRRTQHRVDRLRAQGAADHHQHRLAAVKAGQLQALLAHAGEDLRAQRRAGLNALVAQQLCALRKGRADGPGKRLAELVRQAGRDVALVHDHRDAAHRRADDDGNAHKAALGEDDGRLQLADDAKALEHAGDHAERIGEVLQIKIPAQLAGADRVVSDALHRFDQGALDAVFRANVVDFPALLKQQGNQRLIGGNVAGRAAAGQNNALHKKTSSLVVSPIIPRGKKRVKHDNPGRDSFCRNHRKWSGPLRLGRAKLSQADKIL